VQVCPNCAEENPDRFRLCGYCGTPLSTAPVREVRKTVTVVFSDLKDSTKLGERLDSESLREVVTRYFEVMKAALERHGGSVEKFIGDAVMAVFGLPLLHEDDALRAVRAAQDMRDALEPLNDELEKFWGVRLANRTGVNTGEVVAGDASLGQRLVTGDAVNVAARLEQAAPENEILIGQSTYRLVRDAVEVEVVEPLELKGKSERVPAFRLVDVTGTDVMRRRLDVPMVGREAELRELASAYGATVAEGRPTMVILTGSAGVGKSRLVAEWLAGLQGAARVLRGRCLNYGDGITFWPLAEVVKEAASIRDEDSRLDAALKLGDALASQDPGVAAALASAIGLSEASYPVEETFRGARKLFELLARPQPLVVVFDDVHWAEPGFLDLVDHVVETSDAPMLVLCVSRPDLLEARPTWAEDRSRVARISLDPLSAKDTGMVVHNLLGSGVPAAVRDRISRAADGNPLFVEQILSMMIDDGTLRATGEGAWAVESDVSAVRIPPTISALLSARMDRLEVDERAALDRGSVIGQVFSRGAVEAISTEDRRDGVGMALLALALKQFVRQDQSEPAEDEAYRFLHILIRDAAYASLLKRSRAELHEAFADWVEENAGPRLLEYEEIVGYHLEQAYRYRAELGTVDDRVHGLGARAHARLGPAGRRAFARGDMPAAANLLERAADTLPVDDPARLDLLPELAEALAGIGGFDRAIGLMEWLIGYSQKAGDEVREMNARLVLLFLRYTLNPQGWTAELLGAAEAAIPILEREADHAGLARAYRLQGNVFGTACQYELAERAVDRAVHHAKLAGDRRAETRNGMAFALSALYGPMPVPEAIRRAEQTLKDVAGDHRAEGVVLGALAYLNAMRGDFDGARAKYRRARAILEDLGDPAFTATTSLDSSRAELLAQRPDLAERELRGDLETLRATGERYVLPTTSALLGTAVLLQGRLEEAAALGRLSEETAADDDIESQVLWRRVRARVFARSGQEREAVDLARDAVALADRTDSPILQANSRLDLAEVLDAAGNEGEALARVEEALARYRVKGDLVSEERARLARERITLRPSPGPLVP
jgi:class 3 adenylate cyclase/tetratricopeptide (TPR) repeat protein